MKNYALDTSMLPKVWLTWTSTKNKEFDRRYWVDCQTGVKKETPEPWMKYRDEGDIVTSWRNNEGGFGATYSALQSGKMWIAANSKLSCMYAKYHPDIDRLELASVGLDTTRNGEHKWKYLGDRCFVGKDKSVINENGKVLNQFYIDPTYYYTVNNFRYFISGVMRRNVPNSVLEEFKKFIGGAYFTIGNGSTVRIQHPWDIEKWYISKQKQPSKNKKQKLIDELVSKPLSDYTDLGIKYPISKALNKYGSYNEMQHLVYFENLNEDWDVLRLFYRADNDKLAEQQRVYIRDKGEPVIVSPNQCGGWVSAPQHFNSYWSGGHYLANPQEAAEKCARIKYILSAIPEQEIDDSSFVNLLIAALRFPELEQLLKLGGVKVVKNVVSNRNTKANLAEQFGGYYNTKSAGILRKIGLTKRQFEVYCLHKCNHTALSYMRKLFGDDLSAIDIDSFEKYLKGCISMKECGTWGRSLMGYISQQPNTVNIFKNLVRLSRKEPRIFSIVFDTMKMIDDGLLRGAMETDWCFDDVSDALRLHDAVIELKRVRDEERRALYNLQEAERRKKEEKKRIEVDKARKCYEYEDDNYIIRLPKDYTEIIREGSMQHICIGGYTTRHALGDTNLFFLREKSRPEYPFYAIEMGNNKNIIQIHGFGNRWLGNNPEAIPTVIRWLRKNNISCDKAKLTCKATGYGQRNEYVDMPIVD